MINGKEKLIVAIDTDEFDKAKELIDKLEDSVDIFKVGLEQYVATRGKTVDYLREKGKKIFLDLKFHDIPNTMQSAVRAAVRDNVWLMTIHVSDIEGMRQCAIAAKEEAERLNIEKPIIVGVTVLTSLSDKDLQDIGCNMTTEELAIKRIHVSDIEGMRQCAIAAKEEAERLNIEKPIIVGVTVLTSLSDKDLQDIGCNMTTEELAIKRAKLAKESGIDGIVCSAQEVDKIVEACGKDFVTVCPGIRPASSEGPASSEVGDQKRVVTPADAINKGAHYLVVGRPITKAENPKMAAISIVSEIENA